ncbi:hypothetical protein ME1_00004 [Bartonella vinsonii subsp. arupensis OK-94-513]|uniref:Uncharacterized protein n=2 Tax=Bartonella vinsonii subsp. arupensis TaxID=110578 RepID=J0R552_BARVI|nr:hypothetical protein ME1_00004 [Bartonella vinsonii subsp. arupensis OK-94-513]EJF97561.1 hypothetical protein MEI_01255 [Bartonella vinsonii subsp. arupensis Pm136co]
MRDKNSHVSWISSISLYMSERELEDIIDNMITNYPYYNDTFLIDNKGA